MTAFCRRLTPSLCRRLQIGGLLLVGGLLAAVVLRTWVCQGLILPVRISEASMAPTLLGDHWQVRCPHCDRAFPLDAQPDTRLEQVVCAGCRQPFDASGSAKFQRGDRVLIYKWVAVLGDPARWDVWALRDTRQDESLLVKRVVGLPGEQVALRNGDVYIHGRILRKSLAEFRRLAILVAEEQFEVGGQSGRIAPTAWRTDSASNSWQFREAGWFFAMLSDNGSLDEDCDWLCYGSARDGDTSAIRDEYPYNQSVSRRLNDVHDLLLECDLSIVAPPILWFRAETPTGTWVLRWSVNPPLLELHRDGHLIARKVPTERPPANGCRAEFGYWDRRLQFGVDGQLWLVADGTGEADRANSLVGATRLSIGASRGKLAIRRLRISRDVHYERPRGPRLAATADAGRERVFHVGRQQPLFRRQSISGRWSGLTQPPGGES